MKKRKPVKKKTFYELLIAQLQGLNVGTVEHEVDSDGSYAWVTLQLKSKILEFTFDQAGEHLESVGLFREIREVVDQKQLFP